MELNVLRILFFQSSNSHVYYSKITVNSIISHWEQTQNVNTINNIPDIKILSKV